MTTPLDRTIPATVLSIIARYGVSASLITHTGMSYGSTSRTTTGSEITTTIKVSPMVPLGQDFPGDGSTKQEYHFESWVAASGLAVIPKIGDHLTLSGSAGTLVSVDAFYSGDSIAAYRMVVSR